MMPAIGTKRVRADHNRVRNISHPNDLRVQQLKTQAAANAACPFATNLVAEEIKGIVDSYRQNNPGLRFVVIAGGDDVIPFFRYPDQTMLGQESDYVPPVTGTSDASLRGNFVLSQDAYGWFSFSFLLK